MYILKWTLLLWIGFFTSGFVLLTGPHESRLKTNEDDEVVFSWNGTSPLITDIDSFKDGSLSDLSSAELMESILELVMSIWSNIPGTSINLVMSSEIAEDAVVDRNDLLHSIVVKQNTNLTSAAFAIVNNEESSANPNRNYIVDCDISVSSRPVTASELAFTLLHELGHCIGLGHNHLSHQSVMGYASTREDLELDLDDKLGVLFLYPDEENDEEVEEILPCGTISSFSKSNRNHHLTVVLLLLSPFFLTVWAGPKLHS